MPANNLNHLNNLNNLSNRNRTQPQRCSQYQAYQRELAKRSAIALHDRYVRTAVAYAAVTALCLVFCAVYEIFSFGEHSLLMRMMFMIPLLGGAAPFALLAVSENPPEISQVAFNLWNSGLAVHISGCLVHGIIEISGRVSDYDTFYWVVSGMLLFFAFIIQAAARRKTKSKVRRR